MTCPQTLPFIMATYVYVSHMLPVNSEFDQIIGHICDMSTNVANIVATIVAGYICGLFVGHVCGIF